MLTETFPTIIFVQACGLLTTTAKPNLLIITVKRFLKGREGGKTNFVQMAPVAEMRGMVNLLLTLYIEVSGHVFCR